MAGFPGMPGYPVLDTSNPLLAAMQAQLDNQAALQNILGQTMSSQPGLPAANLASLAGLAGLAGLQGQTPPRGLTGLGNPPSAAAGDFHSQATIDTAKELLQRQSQGASRAMTPAQEMAASMKKLKEDKAEKDAVTREEAEKTRCHLHKKPKKGCKKCDKYEEFLNRGKAEKAALKEKFVNDIRGTTSKSGSGPSTNKRGPIELGNSKTFGFSPLLLSHIVESTHFRNLMTQETFEEVVEEIVNFSDSVEPYAVNTDTSPSALFCCVYRLFTLSLDGQDIVSLLEGQDGRSPYIRCAGFLFVRYGMPVDQLWSWLGEYTLDTGEFQPVKGGDAVTTIGEYVESLLTIEKYYSTILPRLPVGAKRNLEAKLAQVPQYRKRTAANMRLLDVYRQEGVRVEAFLGDDTWTAGEALELDESFTHRVRVRIRFSNGSEEVVPIGKVILTDSRFDRNGGRSRGGRERSRSRSPTGVDWAREKGRGESELVDELRSRARDQAVCSSGKEYARRTVSFNVALRMEQGTASHRLIQEETTVTATKSKRDRSPSPSQLRKGPSLEHQAKMHEIFKKYTAGSSSAPAGGGGGGGHNDIEGQDVMRLG